MPSKEDCENARFKFASAIENPHWIGPVPQYITVKKSRGPNLILTLRDKMWAPVEQWSGYIKGWAMTDLPNAKAINIGDKIALEITWVDRITFKVNVRVFSKFLCHKIGYYYTFEIIQ